MRCWGPLDDLQQVLHTQQNITKRSSCSSELYIIASKSDIQIHRVGPVTSVGRSRALMSKGQQGCELLLPALGMHAHAYQEQIEVHVLLNAVFPALIWEVAFTLYSINFLAWRPDAFVYIWRVCPLDGQPSFPQLPPGLSHHCA
eukprot:1882246-Amphidinium_carterae.1